MDIIARSNVSVSGRPGGQPMLFAHGFGCDQNMWRYVVPAFADDYRIVLFDHVGAGGSDLAAYDRDKYSSLQGYAADTLEIVEALQLSDVIFVGHSVSAMIGLLAAAEQPERFASMVLVGPSPATSTMRDTRAASRAQTSKNCWTRSTATTLAGRARWRRSSWAPPIVRSSWRS